MSELNLNFLDNEYSKNETTYFDILKKYGDLICKYAKGYFDQIVTATKIEGEVQTVSLYILATELPYEYRIMSIEVINISTIKITLFPITEAPKVISVNIIAGIGIVEDKVKEYLESPIANQSLHLLVSKVNLKRKSKDIKE